MSSKTDVKSEGFATTVKRQVRVGLVPLDPDETALRAERTWEAVRFLDIAMDFRENGWPDEARRFARRALPIFERESGVDHPDVVRVLLCLAGARQDLAD
jgi:hypothetical protein